MHAPWKREIDHAVCRNIECICACIGWGIVCKCFVKLTQSMALNMPRHHVANGSECQVRRLGLSQANTLSIHVVIRKHVVKLSGVNTSSAVKVKEFEEFTFSGRSTIHANFEPNIILIIIQSCHVFFVYVYNQAILIIN